MTILLKNILVVEDDATLRTVIEDKLTKSGYTVELAVDGKDAMDKLHAELHPDLILLDVIMPRKNGMEVLEEMHSDINLSAIPVIMLSNSGQTADKDRAKELGAKDFLMKETTDMEEILEKVQALIGGGMPMSKQDGGVPSKSRFTIDLNETVPAQNADAKKGQRLLTVEDDQFLRKLFVQKFTTAGFTVKDAEDAKEAFSILENWKPEIILLDLILPDISGFEILATLKKDERLKNIPIIILSNLGQKQDIDRAMSLGAEGFMVKASFTLEEITEHVQKVLAAHATS
ncbi:MAG TPA: response regulator [Candidatus Kaiserbacteria bacterium]|nr:response regulator [Candidatus Kaiserbacteria bacterium]